MQLLIISEYRKPTSPLHWLSNQVADRGHQDEGHWQVQAGLQGGSRQSLLQLKDFLQTSKMSAERNSLTFLLSFRPDFYSILDTASVWNNSNQRPLPERKWSHFIQLSPKHTSGNTSGGIRISKGIDEHFQNFNL